MIQSQINRNIRLDLADAILLSKAKKDLSFAEIADGTGSGRSLRNRGFAGSAGASCRRRRQVGAKLISTKTLFYCCR